MKTSRIHAILSEIYRLLSDYSASDFFRASEYGAVTGHVSEALRELAREAERFPAEAHSTKARRPKPLSSESVRSQHNSSDEKAEIVSAIRSSRRFSSTQSIIQFAKEMGLKVAPRSKESRQRLAGRLADAILLSPEPRRLQIISQLVGAGDSQTQGWLDVIKGSRS
jgi:hypothetical protein